MVNLVQVDDRLFIGDIRAATSPELHKRHAFRLVVNCTTSVPFLVPAVVPGVTYVRVGVEDNGRPEEIKKLGENIPATVAAIDRHLSEGHNVLVHCRMGRQRSAAIIAAYLMYKYQNFTHDRAIAYVKYKKADTFFPAANFYAALREYNETLSVIRTRRGVDVE
jgi:dual specificity phosphatase 12